MSVEPAGTNERWRADTATLVGQTCRSWVSFLEVEGTDRAHPCGKRDREASRPQGHGHSPIRRRRESKAHCRQTRRHVAGGRSCVLQPACPDCATKVTRFPAGPSWVRRPMSTESAGGGREDPLGIVQISTRSPRVLAESRRQHARPKRQRRRSPWSDGRAGAAKIAHRRCEEARSPASSRPPPGERRESAREAPRRARRVGEECEQNGLEVARLL